MAKHLIVDGNSIGHAANHATKLHAGNQPTQAVYGVIKTIAELRRSYPGYQILVLWDGRAQWRFDLHPLYKSNRDSDPQKVADKAEYELQKPYIFKALTSLGVTQMTVSTHEADDMAGYMIAELVNKHKQHLLQHPDITEKLDIVVITGDQDWIQFVGEYVTWRDIRDDARIVTKKNLYNKTGYPTPYAFLEGKCLQGDTSDVIGGVGGIGKKTAPEFLAKFGSVREFWRQVDQDKLVTKSKVLTAFATPEGRKLFLRNFKLMQLLKVAKPEKANVKLVKGNFNADAFKELCQELSFNSILKTFDGFIRTFKG